jgi:hypothetical protein
MTDWNGVTLAIAISGSDIIDLVWRAAFVNSFWVDTEVFCCEPGVANEFWGSWLAFKAVVIIGNTFVGSSAPCCSIWAAIFN